MSASMQMFPFDPIATEAESPRATVTGMGGMVMVVAVVEVTRGFPLT
jgi:hypothetical protein